MSDGPSVHMEQLEFHRMDFREILPLKSSPKLIEAFSFGLKSDKYDTARTLMISRSDSSS
jgi:hypothetical protein